MRGFRFSGGSTGPDRLLYLRLQPSLKTIVGIDNYLADLGPWWSDPLLAPFAQCADTSKARSVLELLREFFLGAVLI
jgi:hypothetical protein